MRDEERLIPLIQLLLQRRVWQFSDLPRELKAVQSLRDLKNFRWIESRFYVPGYRVDWTFDCDLENWFRAANEETATLEIRVSGEAVRRLDDLSLLKKEERERFNDALSQPSQAKAYSGSLTSEAAVGERRVLHAIDKQVLEALARLARGMTIEMPRPEDPVVDDDWEPGGEEKLLDWVPDLFLWLEFFDSSAGKIETVRSWRLNGAG